MIKHWLSMGARLSWREPQRCLLRVAFYGLMVVLFPLMMGKMPTNLQVYAPAVVWTMLTLTCLQAYHHLFQDDHLHGLLVQVALSRTRLTRYAMVRMGQFWLVTMLPLIMVTPLLALAYQLSWVACGWLMLSLLLGTPSMVLLCAVPAALLQTGRHHATLLCLLVLPLLVPVLVFGSGVLQAWFKHQSVMDPLLLLLAILILCASVLPLAAAHALQLSLTIRIKQ